MIFWKERGNSLCCAIAVVAKFDQYISSTNGTPSRLFNSPVDTSHCKQLPLKLSWNVGKWNIRFDLKTWSMQCQTWQWHLTVYLYATRGLVLQHMILWIVQSSSNLRIVEHSIFIIHWKGDVFYTLVGIRKIVFDFCYFFPLIGFTVEVNRGNGEAEREDESNWMFE